MKYAFIFLENNNYLKSARTTLFRADTSSFLGAEIWPLLSNELKGASSLHAFKNNVKKWKSTNLSPRWKTKILTK